MSKHVWLSFCLNVLVGCLFLCVKGAHLFPLSCMVSKVCKVWWGRLFSIGLL